MVITVTLNPAIDRTLYLEKLDLGKVNRLTKVRQDIGGKGINVSKVLKEFNIDSICTGLLGIEAQEEFKDELDKRNIKHNFISIEDKTRINTKIVDMENKINTDINESGPNITKEELDRFLDLFNKLCKKDDIVVLAGGVSPSIGKDIYGTLTKIAKSKGAFVILDAQGELLKEGLKEIPFAIKPNADELQSILKKELKTFEDFIQGGVQILNMGVEQVLISLGEEGSLILSKDEVLFSKGVEVQTMSTVGAGDSMVASLVYGYINGLNNRETLAFAQGAGTATVMLEGTEACTLENVKKFEEEFLLNIEEVDMM